MLIGMNQKTLLVLTGVLMLVGIYVFIFTEYLSPNEKIPTKSAPVAIAPTSKPIPAPTSPTPQPQTASSDVHDAPSVESYVRKHIVDFSTVKAQLGGTFYVTRVDTKGGVGTVYFEDGHAAYVADFAYTIDDFGIVAVESFKVRK